MVGARAAGTPSRRTEDIAAAAADIMDIDDVQMYNERVPVLGRETLYARTDEISVAFHAALPFEVRRELKGAGVSVLLNSSSSYPSVEINFDVLQTSILIPGLVQSMPSLATPLLRPRALVLSGITPSPLHVTSSRVRLPLMITRNQLHHYTLLSHLGLVLNLVSSFSLSVVISVSGTA